MYQKEISDLLDKKLSKLAKKNRKLLEILNKKINQIMKIDDIENPSRFKNLRGDMKGIKRVHVNTHFVLVFEIDREEKIVKFLDFDHHDKIYEQEELWH